MNTNIEKLSDVLSKNKNLVKEIMNKEDIEEMYEICQKYVTGYTKSEFENYINAAMDEAEGAIEKMKREEEEFGDIAGGQILKPDVEADNPFGTLTVSQAEDIISNLKDNVVN